MTPRQAVTELLEANQGDTMKTAAAVLAALIAFTLGLLSCTPPR